MTFSSHQCSICMTSLINGPIAAVPCGHVFHFKCIHHWLLESNVSNEKNCPSCRTRAKLYDVIRLFGIFDANKNNDEEKNSHEETMETEEIQKSDQASFEELAILRTENAALKRDIKVLQDESELTAQKLENEELREEVGNLKTQLRVKNQELIDCRMTVAEFGLLIPKLEEQQRRSTAELRAAIKRFEELRKEFTSAESKLLEAKRNEENNQQ